VCPLVWLCELPCPLAPGVGDSPSEHQDEGLACCCARATGPDVPKERVGEGLGHVRVTYHWAPGASWSLHPTSPPSQPASLQCWHSSPWPRQAHPWNPCEKELPAVLGHAKNFRGILVKRSFLKAQFLIVT